MLTFPHKVLALGAILALPLAVQPISSDLSFISIAEAKGGNGGGNAGGNSANVNGSGNGGGKAGSNNGNGSGNSLAEAFGSLRIALGFDGLSKGQEKQAEIDGLINSLDKKSEETGLSFKNRGALRSMLGSLNARNASPTAFANAAPESQIGRIGAYIAALELSDAQQALDDFNEQSASDLSTATEALNEAQLALNDNEEQQKALEGLNTEDALATLARLLEERVGLQETYNDLETELGSLETSVEESRVTFENDVANAEANQNENSLPEYEALEAAYNKDLEGPTDPVALAIREVFSQE